MVIEGEREVLRHTPKSEQCISSTPRRARAGISGRERGCLDHSVIARNRKHLA